MHDKHTSSSESCVISAAHDARTLLHLLAIPSRLCLTWLRLSLKISNASSVMRGGGGDACVDRNRRDSGVQGGMLHASRHVVLRNDIVVSCTVFTAFGLNCSFTPYNCTQQDQSRTEMWYLFLASIS